MYTCIYIYYIYIDINQLVVELSIKWGVCVRVLR